MTKTSLQVQILFSIFVFIAVMSTSGQCLYVIDSFPWCDSPSSLLYQTSQWQASALESILSSTRLSQIPDGFCFGSWFYTLHNFSKNCAVWMRMTKIETERNKLIPSPQTCTFTFLLVALSMALPKGKSFILFYSILPN